MDDGLGRSCRQGGLRRAQRKTGGQSLRGNLLHATSASAVMELWLSAAFETLSVRMQRAIVYRRPNEEEILSGTYFQRV